MLRKLAEGRVFATDEMEELLGDKARENVAGEITRLEEEYE